MNKNQKEQKVQAVEGRKNFVNKHAQVTTPQLCVMIATWDKNHNPKVMMTAWAGQLEFLFDINDYQNFN